jgi:hypothetical protein
MKRLLVLATAVLVAVGCSTVPTSSPTVRITQVPTRPDDTVSIEPLSPEPGATQEQIVRGFIEASASTVRGHPVAREHLTPDAAEAWSDEAGITVLSTTDLAAITLDGARVAVTADIIGTVDQRGVFTIGGRDTTFRREFSMEQVEDEWRIADPPDGLLMLESDFQRLYDERAAYFVDPTGQRMVPDPRYLITGQAQPTALVEKLLSGPSAPLAAGVRNPLAGVQLRRTVLVENQTAIVDLTGLPTDPGDPTPELEEICAQLVWTLAQLRGEVRTVQVQIDGEPVELPGVPDGQSTGDWSSFDPDAAPVDAIGHYVDAGALRTTDRGEPAPGPAGNGSYPMRSAAVSADVDSGQLSFMAAVSADGQALLAGPYGGALAAVLQGRSFTVPTVAATRTEIWTVRDGTGVVRVPAGGAPQAVNAPTLSGLGEARVLQLSPDGVRAALVVDGPEGPALYIGTVVRAEDGSVALRDLRVISPTMTRVVDVAWRDGGTLVVLAGDAAQDRIVPYEVGVDGWGLDQVSIAGLPSQPTAIAAAPGRLTLASAGGTIWQLVGGTWSTLVRGQEPLPGTEPFYPL